MNGEIDVMGGTIFSGRNSDGCPIRSSGNPQHHFILAYQGLQPKLLHKLKRFFGAFYKQFLLQLFGRKLHGYKIFPESFVK